MKKGGATAFHFRNNDCTSRACVCLVLPREEESTGQGREGGAGEANAEKERQRGSTQQYREFLRVLRASPNQNTVISTCSKHQLKSKLLFSRRAKVEIKTGSKAKLSYFIKKYRSLLGEHDPHTVFHSAVAVHARQQFLEKFTKEGHNYMVL